ncbi:MAG: cation-transporting P-type ATPase [Clostridium sp.]|uniref:cation-translocating P-type ATPase n=1 Tax=Clostridium sp. TaxID=1506 RepID=UPI0025C3E4FC|nr:cation-transporting P-type ATPase [Clostridium sp.]MCH3964707.1 cation-transporting P-type ATPase [Clostridium sp.]MCI1715178.1 cation-transporting P-type ATPase [Clostridium sp.]MCI1799440.1 cation-transporting P-type ATPase [Clostridium sp.]MCI1813361.1 cation-transporting P-type ATPase [Clostridium sp.]MCI1870252.1 cation-transporting P-type ATPase [Clostridium sp.]
MTKWYKRSWSEIVKELNSSSYYGLDDEQIEPSRKKYGSNKITIPATKNFIWLIFIQFRDIWVLFFAAGFGILLYLKLFLSAAVVLSIVLINVICVALGQHKKEKNIKELQRLNSGYARVIRNGRTLKIQSEELVVGDIVIVGSGESIPADMRIIESSELKVDECSVTGEKFLSDKYEPKIEDSEINLSDMKNMLFKSSVVVKGDATGIVVSVGMKTEIAGILKLLLEENKKNTSFKSNLNSILDMFIKFSICSILFVNLFRYGIYRDSSYMSIRSVLIMISSFPIGFCIITYLMSNILLSRLKKKDIIFKNILSVEKFSRVSAVCTDKVGGFSKERMDIVKAYGSKGFIDIDEETLREGMDEHLYRMLNIGLLCNDIKSDGLENENSKDDLVETSVSRFAEQYGLYRKEVQQNHKKLFQISFDTDRRIMTTVNEVDKKYRANSKGAVDAILERCTHILKNGVEVQITEDDINSIRDADINMSNDSLNVIGFAYRNFNYEPSQKENVESNLVFAGLIGFNNKLKETAQESIKKSRALSIKPVLITEDSKLTALAVGRKLGIVKRLNEILSGVEMDNMDDEEFKRIGERISIFSRINSNHKIQIIKALKEYGYITAITGWKLTDLPALSMSNIGIANTGSNIVKKLSDILIKNIDFMNLLNLIEASRKIVKAIRKMIVYITTCSFGFLVFLLMGTLYGSGFGIEEGIFFRSIWFNTVVMFLSSMAIICQYDDESPEYNSYSINKNIVKDRINFVVFSGFLMGLWAFIAFQCADFLGCKFSGNIPFIILNICAVIFTYSFSNSMLFKNKLSNFIIIISFMLQLLAAVLLDKFNNLFDIVYWAIVFAAALIWLLFGLFYKFDKENYYND